MRSFLFCSFVLFAFSALAQKQFDIVQFQPPAGWQEAVTAEQISYTKEANGNFCIITVYKSKDAGNNAKQNFDQSWASVLQKTLPVAAPLMQPPVTEDGWATEIGSAAFEKESIKGIAILIASTKKNKLLNIVVLMNNTTYVNDMQTFLTSVKRNEPANNAAASGSNTSSTSVNNVKPEPGPAAEVWMNVQYSLSYAPDINPSTQFGSKLKPKFYVVYPNGDYYPHFPVEGLSTLTNQQKNESWGTFTLSGKKGLFKSKYETIEVEKLSATKMKKIGYTFHFYKCAAVDGLKLNGEWGAYPGWKKAAASSTLLAKQVIAFQPDGIFIDYGLFVTNLSMPDQYPQNKPGKGTYSIRNYTLTLQYNDGRIIYKAFTGAADINPANDNRVLYIGTNPCYKE